MQIMSCFIMSAEHNRRRYGVLEPPPAILSRTEARTRLRALPELSKLPDDALDRVLAALAEWDLAFELSAEESHLYGQSGFLFPSLRAAGELFLVPTRADGTSDPKDRWLGEKVREWCAFLKFGLLANLFLLWCRSPSRTICRSCAYSCACKRIPASYTIIASAYKATVCYCCIAIPERERCAASPRQLRSSW